MEIITFPFVVNFDLVSTVIQQGCYAKIILPTTKNSCLIFKKKSIKTTN